MNVRKQSLCCAMVVISGIGLCARADVEDSPFGGAEKPASAAGRAPKEKSVLAEAPRAEQTEKDAQHAAADFCQCVGESESVAVVRIEQALNGPLHSSGLDFVDTPLQDVITALQDDYGIPIQLDTVALEEIGVGTDEQVTINLHNISLRSALRLMLQRLQLASVIENEVLIITSHEHAESQLKTCVYDVGTLAGERDTHIDSIIDTIVSCVATDTWAKNGGGQAEVRAIKPGLLVISQTRPVHEEIRSLLATLRKMKEAHGPAPNATAVSAPHAAEDVVTRSYLLQLNPTDDLPTMRNQVRELITGSLPEETWSGRLASGEGVMLSVFHDRIVVRQTPAVQQKVQTILADSGVATPTMAVAAMPGARSGGFGGSFGGMGGRGGGGGGFFRPADEGPGAVHHAFGAAPGFEGAAGPEGGTPGFSGEPTGVGPEPSPGE